MTPEAVLSHPARVLTRGQREDYFTNGYVAVESLFGAEEVARIRAVVDEFVEKSRHESRSGDTFDLAPGHTAPAPRIRRLKRPNEQHELFWEVATGMLADVAADLVERCLLEQAVAELGGAGGLVPRDPCRDLEIAG